MAPVLALFILAIYPDTVEATIINDGSDRLYFDSRDLFLDQLPLSNAGLSANACNIAYLQAGASPASKSGARTSELAKDGAELNSLAFLPADRLVGDGDLRPSLEPGAKSSGFDPMIWELNRLSSDARLSSGDIADLVRIKTSVANIGTRVTNIGNCLKYFRYLLETIGVIFRPPQKNNDAAFTALGRNVENNQTNLVFMTTRRSVATIPGSASSSGSAIDTSEYLSKHGLLSTYSTVSDTQQSSSTMSSDSREGVSSAKRPKKSSGRSVKEYVKEFIIDIFSQAYTYILIFVITIFSFFMKVKT